MLNHENLIYKNKQNSLFSFLFSKPHSPKVMGIFMTNLTVTFLWKQCTGKLKCVIMSPSVIYQNIPVETMLINYETNLFSSKCGLLFLG